MDRHCSVNALHLRFPVDPNFYFESSKMGPKLQLSMQLSPKIAPIRAKNRNTTFRKFPD